MADSLLTALQGLRYDPLQTTAGMAAQTAAKIAPALIQPGQGIGTQLGLSLGSMLVTSLLGRAAANAANEETIANQRLAAQLTPLPLEDRLSRIEQVEDPLSRRSLIDYSNQLRAQEVEVAQSIQKRLAELQATAGAEVKAEGEFYRSPEGQQYWDEYIKRQEELGKTRRIGVEEFGLREGIKTEEIQKRDKAKMDLDIEERMLRNVLDNKAKLELDRELNAQREKSLREGTDYETERGKIFAKIKGDENIREALVRSSLAMTRQNYAETLKLQGYEYKRKLDRDMPTVSTKIKDDFAKSYGAGIVGLQLAEDIENEASRLDVLTARNAFTSSLGGTAQINARLQAFVNEYRAVVTGQAAAEAELARIESVIKGSASASPEEVAMRIREIVKSARTKATESLAAATTSLDELVSRVRQNPLDMGGFNVKAPEVGSTLKLSLSPPPIAGTVSGIAPAIPSAMPTVAPTISQKEQKKQALYEELEQIRKARGAKK